MLSTTLTGVAAGSHTITATAVKTGCVDASASTSFTVLPKTQLIVIKDVVNDNGGTAVASDFTMSVSGNNPSPASFPGAESLGTMVALDAGSYSVTESSVLGYTQTSISDDCSGSIAVGQTKTCIITNDDIQPLLTVTKVIINDNGGTLTVNDFPLFIDGNPVTSGVANTVNAGTHTVSETSQTGYTATIGGDCAHDGTITLNLAENKECTITNDDQPAKLIVIKKVINDNDGTKQASDFKIFVTGNNPDPAKFPGKESPGTTVTINAGTYDVSEEFVFGYEAKLSPECSGTIGNGETKTCTITNNDIAPGLPLVRNCVLATQPKDPVSMNSIVGKKGNTPIAKTLHIEKHVFECEDANDPSTSHIVDVALFAEIYEDMNDRSILRHQVEVINCMKDPVDGRVIGCERRNPSEDVISVQNCSEVVLSHPEEMNTVSSPNGKIVKTIDAQKEIFQCDNNKTVDVVIFTEIWEDMSKLPGNPAVKRDVVSLRCTIASSFALTESCIFTKVSLVVPP